MKGRGKENNLSEERMLSQRRVEFKWVLWHTKGNYKKGARGKEKVNETGRDRVT